MINVLRSRGRQRDLIVWVVVGSVLALALVLGRRASLLWIVLFVSGAGAVLLLTQPSLRLPSLVTAALIVPASVGTGSDVQLGTAALLIPVLSVLWLLGMLLKREARLPVSRVFRPLLLFLLAGILSLLIGNATWDPMVPRPPNFTLVQVAQWAIFALSGTAFTLMASWTRSESALRGITLTYLLVGGVTTILWASPMQRIISPLLAVSPGYPPLLTLLGTLAAAELLHDRQLSARWRWFLAAVLIAVIYQSVVGQRESVSTLISVLTSIGILAWLRLPRFRWAVFVIITLLGLSGQLFPAAYELAGGDDEWTLSGGSRLVLTERVIEATMRNPITGLGPAAYRPYTRMKPLPYGTAYWLEPQISAHNNYVDLFAHGGLVGLGIFLWFMIEVARLALQLQKRAMGFARGYTDAMLAIWGGIMLMMVFGDWFLPFVYNLGFPALQGSALLWMFFGGLVALQGPDQSQDSACEQ